MNRDGKGSNGGLLLLLGVCLLAFVAQYVSTKPTAPPEATQAITRFVKQGRQQSAVGSQETKEGYVIDPSLAQRMLADTAIQVRVTGIRGFSDNVIARAMVKVPGANGAEESSIRYFALQREATEWNATGEVKARSWYLKIW